MRTRLVVPAPLADVGLVRHPIPTPPVACSQCQGRHPVACLRPLAEKHYAASIEGYTKAIALNPNVAVYWANRAAAHIKLESYGSAVADAEKATDIDPKYIKVSSACIVKSILLPCDSQRLSI